MRSLLDCATGRAPCTLAPQVWTLQGDSAITPYLVYQPPDPGRGALACRGAPRATASAPRQAAATLHAQALKPAWEQAAKALKGIVAVGAVDCDTHKEVAGEFRVQGFPTIKLLYVDESGSVKSADYQGGRSAKVRVAGSCPAASCCSYREPLTRDLPARLIRRVPLKPGFHVEHQGAGDVVARKGQGPGVQAAGREGAASLGRWCGWVVQSLPAPLLARGQAGEWAWSSTPAARPCVGGGARGPGGDGGSDGMYGGTEVVTLTADNFKSEVGPAARALGARSVILRVPA